jgi:hypothetical protein
VGCNFFAVEIGVIPKCGTDFQNTPYRNIFCIELGYMKLDISVWRLIRRKNDEIPPGVFVI